MVAVGAAWLPVGCLLFECADDGGVVERIDLVVERYQAGPVRQQLGEGDVLLAVGGELRPEGCDLCGERDGGIAEGAQ